MIRNPGRVLIIEDDAGLRAALARVLVSWGAHVSEAGTASEAKALLAGTPPNLLIVDVRLPDETAFEILEEAARRSPAPIAIAMSGKASPEEAFLLAQKGVRAYLAKPVSIPQLEEAIRVATGEPPVLEPLISASVGHVPLREVQREVRRVMVTEALARTDGSKSGAARLLRVSRQALQQIMRRLPARPRSSDARASNGDRAVAGSRIRPGLQEDLQGQFPTPAGEPIRAVDTALVEEQGSGGRRGN